MTDRQFEELLVSMRPIMVGLAKSRGARTRQDAEDAVQEAILKLWRVRGDIREETADRYLKKAVCNAVADQDRRARSKSRPHTLQYLEDSLIEESDARAGVEDGYPSLEVSESKEARERIAGMSDLPEFYRETALMVLDGLSAVEIAKRMGLAPSTVRGRVLRLRLRLAGGESLPRPRG